MEKQLTFWTATKLCRDKPPGNWTFQKWVKTESSFSVKYSHSAVHCMNGKEYCLKYPDHTTKDDLKMFFLWVAVPGEAKPQVYRVDPNVLYATLEMTIAKINQTFNWEPKAPVKAPAKSPKAMRAQPKPPKCELTGKVGAYVKVVSGPYPEVMKKTVQRIDARRPGEAQITRWLSRKDKRVSAWVPIEHLEILPDYVPPRDNCLRFGANTEGSAPDAFKRGWCRLCSMRDHCDWYQREGANAVEK